MIDIKEKDIIDIIYELTHIKDEEGNDVPHFCFASDIAMDLDAKEDEIAIIAADNGYSIYKIFPGETMVGGLVILADGATMEPVEQMYKEFYGEVPDMVKMELDADKHLVEIEDIVKEDLEKNTDDLLSSIKNVVSKYDGDKHKFSIMDAEPGSFVHEYGDDEPVDFSKLTYHKEGEVKDEYGANKPLVTFMLNGGLNGSGKWTDYLKDIAALFTSLEKETGLNIEVQDISNDIPDDVWTCEVLMYNDKETSIKEALASFKKAFKLNEDLELDVLPEITDKDRFGDSEAFMQKYIKEAEDLGAKLVFNTKVGPKRIDSLWYEGQDIATLYYEDYAIEIYGLPEDIYVITDDDEIDFDEFEEHGIYNDETYPEDYGDAGFAGIEFSIVKQDGRNREPYSSYGDLNFDTMWDLESALDIKSYIEDVIPAYEEEIGIINESKNKRPKIRVRDPNAEAMWGRTRHKVELPKKGKGSFKRHAKHKLHEIFVTPDKDDVDEFLKHLKDAGFIIESTREEGEEEDDGKDIHIQAYDGAEIAHQEYESAKDVYEHNKEEIDNRIRELSDVIDDYGEETNNKYHITYSIGFGGTARDGTDCTGRVTAGIDMRAYWLEPEAVEIGEDLDLDVHDMSDFVFSGENEYVKEIQDGAKSVGATVTFWDRVCPNRKEAIWYDGTVATIEYPEEGLGIDIMPSGETKFSLDGDTIRYPDELEEAGIFTDGQLYDADSEGRVDWDMNPWWEFRVFLLEDDRKGEYGGDMGYDCMSDLDEALDVPGYADVIADFKENWLKDLKESKKKKNPLKAAARRHAKTDKKGAMGWFIHPNVEQSIQHFNHVANGSAESTITAPVGLGEDVDLDVADKYEWEYDLASAPKYRTVGYKFDDNEQVYTGEKYWYSRIPETCMKVSRDDYKDNKLLNIPKNEKILKGVEKFFKDHPSAKYCVLGCKDISRGGYGRYVNAYRVLLESREAPLTEDQSDYWVLSDGVNPKNSNVYSKIDDLDDFIARLEAGKPQKYWELLHYVDGEPIRVWSTNEMKEDLDLDVMKSPRSPSGIRFEAHPREEFMRKPSGRYWYRKQYPEFVMPSNGKQIFKSLYNSGRYMLCKAAEKVVDKFFKDNPRKQYCVLLAFDKDNHPVIIGQGDEGLFGLQIPESINEAAEKHDTLNPKLWDESNKLKPEVREKILEIVKDFTDGLTEDEIKFKIDDIVIVGSNCSYNYNDKSDLDVHIRMDTDSLECPDDLYPLVYSAYRSLFNNKYDIDFYGIPVELYVETSETEQLNDEPIDKPE